MANKKHGWVKTEEGWEPLGIGNNDSQILGCLRNALTEGETLWILIQITLDRSSGAGRYSLKSYLKVT
jgi:hypothetical protein